MTEQEYLKLANLPHPPRDVVFAEHGIYGSDEKCWGYVCKHHPEYGVTNFITEDGRDMAGFMCIFGCGHFLSPTIQ